MKLCIEEQNRDGNSKSNLEKKLKVEELNGNWSK